MTRAVIYTRISKDQAGRRLGVDRQEAACRELAAQLGWTVLHVYEDNDQSAGKDKDPPQYKKMIAACEAGLVDAIIVAKVDRLHRQIHKFFQFMQWRKTLGIKFATTEGDNTETASGRVILNIKASLAEGEWDRIQERINAAVRQRAERGQFNGGRLPYYVNHPEAVAWVRDAARDVLDGRSLHSITKEWNNLGRRTSQGNLWVPHVIRRMLINPSVIAKRELDGETFNVPWDPVLDHTTYTNVRAILTASDRRAHEVNHRKYMLSGLLRCANLIDDQPCGHLLSTTGPKGNTAFECSSSRGLGCGKVRILMEPLDLYITEQVLFALDTPRFRKAAAEQRHASDDTAAELRLAISNDKQSLITLSDEKDDGLIDEAEYRRRRVRLTKRLDDNQAKLSALPRARASVPPTDELREVWPVKDNAWKRTIVSAVIERVDVHPHPRGMAPLTPRRSQEPLTACHDRWMATVDARTDIQWAA